MMNKKNNEVEETLDIIWLWINFFKFKI